MIMSMSILVKELLTSFILVTGFAVFILIVYWLATDVEEDPYDSHQSLSQYSSYQKDEVPSDYFNSTIHQEYDSTGPESGNKD